MLWCKTIQNPKTLIDLRHQIIAKGSLVKLPFGGKVDTVIVRYRQPMTTRFLHLFVHRLRFLVSQVRLSSRLIFLPHSFLGPETWVMERGVWRGAAVFADLNWIHGTRFCPCNSDTQIIDGEHVPVPSCTHVHTEHEHPTRQVKQGNMDWPEYWPV